MRTRFLFLLACSGILLEGCVETATEYRVGPGHPPQRLATLTQRSSQVSYRLDNHVFELDLRPIRNALVSSSEPRTLARGEGITSFIVFMSGPSSGAAHKTRFGGRIGRMKKLVTIDELKSQVRPGGAGAELVLIPGKFLEVGFRGVNGQRWLVSSVFKDSAKQMIQAEIWAAVTDDFLVTFWMHVDDLAPMDATLRNAEVERLRELVRRFHSSP